MALDTSPRSDARDGQDAPAGTGTPEPATPNSPFSLASLLGLNEDELAQPLSRAAPEEHRWEQFSLGLTPETGEAEPSAMRSGAASQPPTQETELIPGLDVPGAVEVPVYLAGRTLHDLIRNTPPSVDAVTDGDEPGSAIDDAWTLPAVNDGTDTAAASDVPLEAAIETPARTPVRPPAIAVPGVGHTRKKPEPPAANFARADAVPVLWPKRKKTAAASALPQECARCGAAYDGDRCEACGNDTAVSARARKAGAWNDIVAAFLESDNRGLRTLGALVLAPGELTAAFLLGHRRRYLSPLVTGAVTLVLFGLIASVGSLRPRPDRALMIGADRTVETLPGLADSAPVNLAVDSPPDLVRDVASALDFVPLLWLPLMLFGVVAVLAATRAFRRQEDHAELLFAAHFTAWFVLWWGLAIPVALLTAKFGFEYAAAFQGVTRVSYLDDGRIEGLSAAWNWLRQVMVSRGLHSGLLAVGLVPWAVMAYRRAFDSSWQRALVAGTLVAAVPILLLTPFG